MDEIATDDQSKRLPFRWLGPPGLRWPVDARLSAWGVALVLTVTFVLTAWVLAPTVGLKVLGVVAATAAALTVTRKVMRHVDYDRPVRHHMAMLVAEVRTPRPPTAEPDTYELHVDPDLFADAPPAYFYRRHPL